ncbi:MAG: hypothetical protein AAFY63_01350 [Cyanobacteria bacterium J06643_13]
MREQPVKAGRSNSPDAPGECSLDEERHLFPAQKFKSSYRQ